jgi:hypothetical protein
MEQEERERGTCIISDKDDQGNPNLCCCYIVKPDGSYEDPCYTPVEDCCSR